MSYAASALYFTAILFVFFTFASDTACTVRVHAAAAGSGLVPQPATRYNGRLSLSCDDKGAGDVPRIQAAFLAFKP